MLKWAPNFTGISFFGVKMLNSRFLEAIILWGRKSRDWPRKFWFRFRSPEFRWLFYRKFNSGEFFAPKFRSGEFSSSQVPFRSNFRFRPDPTHRSHIVGAVHPFAPTGAHICLWRQKCVILANFSIFWHRKMSHFRPKVTPLFCQVSSPFQLEP